MVRFFELRVAVVNGALQDLKKVMKIINEDKDRWHFIEVMNCPGGCVNGAVSLSKAPAPHGSCTDTSASSQTLKGWKNE